MGTWAWGGTGLVAVLALAAPNAHADGVRRAGDLAGAARCVSEYLAAVAAAAAPRVAPSHGTSTSSSPDDPRWRRARERLAPAALRAGIAGPLTPWATFAQGGAFVAHELVTARRAPRGAAVVVAREHVAATRADDAAERRCAYLVAPVQGAWRIADARCGRDYRDEEVLTGWPDGWDAPAVERSPPSSARAASAAAAR